MERPPQPSLIETVLAGPRAGDTSTAHSSAAEEGRFVPGALIAGRYRIIALLGRGGMGEVYRATDLTLGQSIALKFLPEQAANDLRLLERFHGEVRLARQVSHPNVCRVYDIGQADGMPFISMEYIDGEDLASLLTRIGRLPVDKAVDVARKVCAGLAAAHARGIVHRDLKPQNIMIDKRGEVVIMDFGLAALGSQLTGRESRDGTPAYMAPEQLKGADITQKSDIYSLGLVLYELFTGKRPFDAKTVRQLLDQQESGHLTSMTSIAAEIDPAVERAIRRCLDPEPARRPASALAVAAALPGGDPLVVALAAGEMPSPELVAAAGKNEALPRRLAIPCLLAILVCLGATLAIHQASDAILHTPLALPPDALAVKARGFAQSFGFPRPPGDSTLWLSSRSSLITYLKKLPQPHRWDEWLAAEAPVMAHYRESLSPLIAEPDGEVDGHNPPPTAPGMIEVSLDSLGQLREFSAIPYDLAGAPENPAAAEAVFRVAGLDFAKFTETSPDRLPPAPADQIRAWKGPHPKIPATELRVEVATWKGRVTFATVAFPWATAVSNPSSLSSREIYTLLLSAAGMLAMAPFARRNWKRARVDRKGALRIAAASFLLDMIGWFGDVHAVPTADMLTFFYRAAGNWLIGAAVLWLMYLAIEPAIRARWPHSIVTWNRVLAGRWRDSQVAAHVLIGAAMGSSIWLAASLVDFWRSAKGDLGAGGDLYFTMGSLHWIAGCAHVFSNALFVSIALFFAVFAFRFLLRLDVLAAIAASLLFIFSEGNVASSPHWQIQALIYFVIYASIFFLLLRYGLVATMAAVVFINGSNAILLGGNWQAWYVPYGLASLLLLLAIALASFWQALGPGGLLGDALDAEAEFGAMA
jgi:serine/threonine-protein kinase